MARASKGTRPGARPAPEEAEPVSQVAEKVPAPKEKPPRPLKPDHQRFLGEYLVNGNNATRAMVTVRPDYTEGSAKVSAHRALHSANVQATLQQLMRESKTEIVYRFNTLGDVLHTRRNVAEYFDGEGKLTSRVETTGSRDRLRAIELLNKMDGTYAKAQAIGDAARHAYGKLMGDYTRRLRASIGLALDGEPCPTTGRTEQEGIVVEPSELDSTAEQAEQASEQGEST